MINYRKANIDDIEILIKFRIDFLKEVNKEIKFKDFDDLNKNLTDYYKSKITNKEFICWLAFDEDKLIGSCGICFYETPPNFKNIRGRKAYIMKELFIL